MCCCSVDPQRNEFVLARLDYIYMAVFFVVLGPVMFLMAGIIFFYESGSGYMFFGVLFLIIGVLFCSCGVHVFWLVAEGVRTDILEHKTWELNQIDCEECDTESSLSST